MKAHLILRLVAAIGVITPHAVVVVVVASSAGDNALKGIQESVGRQVDETNANGGLAISFGYKFTSSLGGGRANHNIVIPARLPMTADGVMSEEQQLLIDVGSSTLAFCNHTLALSEVQKGLETDYGQCNSYSAPIVCTKAASEDGFSNATCVANPNPIINATRNETTCIGHNIFFPARVHRGNVDISSSPNNRTDDSLTTTMENVSYSIFSPGGKWGYCENGYVDGIFGIAFTGLNRGYALGRGGGGGGGESPANASSLLTILCEDTSEGALAKCPPINTTTTTELIEPPLQQLLGNADQETFGLYFPYEVTFFGNSDGVLYPEVGIFYGSSAATDNVHYRGGTPQKTVPYPKNPYGNSDYRFFWSFYLERISVSDGSKNGTTTVHEYPSDYCGSKGSNCFVDSGNPSLQLPVDSEICDRVKWMNKEELMEGAFHLHLRGAPTANGSKNSTTNGSMNTTTTPIVTLRLPYNIFVVQLERGWITCSGTESEIYLGLPIWQYYYVVFNVADGSMEFVDRPNVTQLFLVSGASHLYWWVHSSCIVAVAVAAAVLSL